MSGKTKGVTMPRKTPRKRTQVMLDEDIFEAFKAVPRSVSVSDIVNVIFRAAIEDLKKFPQGMTKEEMIEWRKADSKRIETIKYIREDLGLGKYVDVIADTIEKAGIDLHSKKGKKVKG